MLYFLESQIPKGKTCIKVEQTSKYFCEKICIFLEMRISHLDNKKYSFCGKTTAFFIRKFP